MIRTQIQLDQEQADALRRLSSERRTSIAALIREAVADYLATRDRAEPLARALRAAGSFRSGTGDLAAEHDRYAAEVFGE